jgi:hypothetical protein
MGSLSGTVDMIAEVGGMTECALSRTDGEGRNPVSESRIHVRYLCSLPGPSEQLLPIELPFQAANKEYRGITVPTYLGLYNRLLCRCAMRRPTLCRRPAAQTFTGRKAAHDFDIRVTTHQQTINNHQQLPTKPSLQLRMLS